MTFITRRTKEPDLGTATYNLAIRNDPWYIICSKAAEDSRYERIVQEILAGNKELQDGYQHYNMDGGPFFHDTRSQSIITAAATSVTGATTDKLVQPASTIAVPPGYFIAGKKLRQTLYVAVTTGTTPGNGGVELYVGSADAGGTLVASKAAVTNDFVATQTNLPFYVTAHLVCRGGAVETAKPVLGYAWFMCPTALMTAANQQAGNPIPATAPATVNIDNTLTTLGFNIQFKNSGANANSYITHDFTFEALS